MIIINKVQKIMRIVLDISSFISWISELTHDYNYVISNLENQPKRREIIALQLEDERNNRYYLRLLFDFIR
jgi:hypothetical protein